MIHATIPLDEPERLAALRQYHILDTPPEPAFDSLVQLAAHIVEVPIALVVLIDSDRQWFKARYGLDLEQTPRSQSFCGHVVANPSSLVVGDALLDERFHDNPLVTGEPRIRFYLGVPLTSPSGFALGTVCCIDRKPRELTDRQVAMVQLLAAQVVELLELRRERLHAVESAQTLASSDATLRTLLQSLPGIYCRFTKSGYFTDIHGRNAVAAEPRNSDGTKMNWRDFLSPGDETKERQIWEALVKARAQDQVAVFQIAYPSSGPAKQYEARVAAVSDSEDMVALVLDVSLRHQAEIEQQRQEQTIRDYSAWLDALFTSAPDGIVTVNEQEEITQVNKSLTRMFGYQEAELLGSKLTLLLPALQQQRHGLGLREYGATGQKPMRNREVVAARKDGSLFYIEVSSSSFELQGRRHYTAIVRDISERQTMRARSEFVAMVSHELRAPLHSMVGLSEALLDDPAQELTARQRERIAIILDSGHHLRDLVRDILDVSRIELGMLRLDCSLTEVNSICDRSLAMVIGTAEQKQITLHRQYGSGDQMLTVDRKRLAQILVNLLDNAIKFTMPGGRVELAIRRSDSAIEFLISDTGIGIADADRARIFLPFSQVDSSHNRKYQGTGLGLHLARRLALLHGGDIYLRSTPGQGSTFTLSLPATASRLAGS